MANDIVLSRILITNDDGIDAEGLAVLEDSVAAFARELWVVAPREDQSGASQKISLRSALQIEQRGPRRFAVNGTPSDCVALALGHLMKKDGPDLIVSGVNATANVGDEVNLSGTVGAALTGLMTGVPSLAVSQSAPSHVKVRWDTTRVVLPLALERLLAGGWRKETCLCLNIPDLPPEKIKGLSRARQGKKNISSVKVDRRVNPRGETYFWLSLEHAPCEADPRNEETLQKRGFISVLEVGLNRAAGKDEEEILFDDPLPCDEDLAP